MPIWWFRDFVNERGENVIHTWLNSAEVSHAKAKINARIATLQGFPFFPEQYFSSYQGWDGLYELRIGFGGVQFRPFGFYGPGRRQFTLLVGGIEKGGKVPRSLLTTAHQRRVIASLNPTRFTCEHDFS